MMIPGIPSLTDYTGYAVGQAVFSMMMGGMAMTQKMLARNAQRQQKRAVRKQRRRSRRLRGRLIRGYVR